MLIYDAEVSNGGHSQYCLNSSGDHWKVALAGLKAVGAPSRAAILQATADLFGTD
ncbi:MAG UNVERIFIED_CONTAM: DMP19 family protein [Planctomycetaceae bacterium]